MDNFFKGFDAPAFDTTPQQPPVRLPVSKAQPPKTTGRGGTLTSLISEGGALGGAAAGAAIGSAVPVIGTAIGGIIGAGLGAFGGRLAENKVRDDRLGVTDALKEGAITAVLSGPLRLGKYGVTAGKGLLAGKGAQEALGTAAQKAADLSLRNVLGTQVSNATKDLVIKQFRINPSQLTGFAKKHGEDVTELISRFKIGTADDVASKGINPLLSTFDDIVDNIPDISKKKLEKILNKEVTQLLKSPVETNRLLGQRLQSQADTLLKSQPANIPGVVAKKLRQEFDDAVKYTLTGSPERTVAKRTADAIRKVLQNAADDAGLKGPNGLSMKELGKEISKLVDLQDIVTKQSNLGRGNLPVGIISGLGGVGGAVSGAGAAGAGGAAFGGPVGAALGFLGTQAINSPTGRRLLAQGGQRVGAGLVSSGTQAAQRGVRQAVLGAARGAMGEGLTGGVSTQPQNLEDILMNIPQTGSEFGAVSPETGMMGTSPEQQFQAGAQLGGVSPQAAQPTVQENPFTPELLIQAIAADPRNAALYERIYNIYEKRYAAPKAPKLSSTAIKQLSDYDKSLTNLDEVESLIQQNSDAFGPVRGRIRGAIPQDVVAKSIRQATLIAAQNIGRALEGGKLTDADIARYQAALPSITDTPEVALNKINRLRRLISSEAQTFGELTAQLGGAGSLEDAILSQTGGAQ